MSVRSLSLNGLCVLLSLAVALAVCEVGLRLLYPRYHHIAEAHRQPDEQRIWKPPPGSHYRRPHPDTGRLHLVIHNSLGARQHREFTQEDLDGAVSVAFFGDSFTENLRLPVQYSFHAVLDFLLNGSPQPGPLASERRARGLPLARKSPQPGPLADERRARGLPQLPRRFNVLNFGVDGYGAGQQYLHYRSLPPEVKATIKHVFYIFYSNDIRDLRHNGIFHLDDAGGLVERLPTKTPFWIRMLGRAHLTYATMDGAERLRREWRERFPGDGENQAEETPDLRFSDPERANPSFRLWRTVVMRWKAAVETAGAQFTLVELPADHNSAPALKSLPASVETLSLRDCFRETVSDPPPRHMVRFETDYHWNEAANMVAAHCLHRFLVRRFGLPPTADDALARQRYVYYRAFADAPDWEGGRWMPEPPWASPGAFSPSAGRAIVEKYLALENDPARLAEHWRRVVARAKADGVLASGVWDIYAAWDERLFVYVKAPCAAEDLRPYFFLQVWPARPVRTGWRGFTGVFQLQDDAEHVNAGPFFTIRGAGDGADGGEGGGTGEECVVGVRLPGFEFSRARAGQFVRPRIGDGVWRREDLWAVDVRLRKYPD